MSSDMSGMSTGDVWVAFLFFVLPLLVCYVVILVVSYKHDRSKR
jgi:hypothetical protein